MRRLTTHLENDMRNLDCAELNCVAGGETVDTNLGKGAGYILHGVTSPEAQTLGLVSPAGWFIGAVLHYATTH